jgi:plastocyanin
MQLRGLVVALSSIALGVSAKSIDIDVGKDGLVFTPDTVTAAVGDELHFHFYSPTHGVVQGDFANACKPASGGFYSGIMSVSGNEGVISPLPGTRTSTAARVPDKLN